MSEQKSRPDTIEAKSQRTLRYLIFILVIILTFEGLVRKLDIPGANVPIFLLKDFLVLVLALHIMRLPRPPALDFLWYAYFTLIALFIPVFISTALHDPLLALFGAKQYLLYPFVALGVFMAFENSPISDINRFFCWTALLIIPTVIIALIQLRLPATHWLNLSVDGESTAAFSAGGKLRVSSTFSFVAQYSMFLNAEMFMLIIAFNRLREMNFLWKIIYLALVPLLVVSCYITGSRGAVVGNMSIIMIASILTALKLQGRNSLRVFMIIAGFLLIVFLGQHFLPDEFAAYSEREQGKLLSISEEIQLRVYYALFGWVANVFSVPFFGYGIGIMSNGSNTFSNYADSFRSQGEWTETDFATTLFEGGAYLVAIWYGFRYYIIFQTTKRSLLSTNEELSLSGSFSQALVIIFGLTAALGIQPPLAIWWWLAVGTSLLFWWKSVEPTSQTDDQGLPPPKPQEHKIRGRSAYAERLHANK